MQPTQLELKGLHLPEALSWWPPAWGWWLVAVAAVLVPALLFAWYRRLTRQTAVKTAKKLLAALKQNPDLDNGQKLRELSVLLRRVAISIAPDPSQVAGLTGASWLAFLDQGLPDAPFSLGVGAALADGPYRRSVPGDAQIAQLFTLCEAWLKDCVPANRRSKRQKKSL